MVEKVSNFITDYSALLSYLGLFSVIFLILSVLLIPKLIARIPSDYFSTSHTKISMPSMTISRLIAIIIKNILGVILIIAGVLMLVLPGQGLITLFIGILLLNFPGKYQFERYLIRKPAILNSLNWIRRRQNIPDLSID